MLEITKAGRLDKPNDAKKDKDLLKKVYLMGRKNKIVIGEKYL